MVGAELQVQLQRRMGAGAPLWPRFAALAEGPGPRMPFFSSLGSFSCLWETPLSFHPDSPPSRVASGMQMLRFVANRVGVTAKRPQLVKSPL